MKFLSLLTILFIGLKLTGYIDWSWWYVTMPLWLIPVSLIGFAGIIAFIVPKEKLMKAYKNYKNKKGF